MNDRKPLIAGNWKMNLSIDDSRELISGISAGLSDFKGLVKPAVGQRTLSLSDSQDQHGPTPTLPWGYG